MCSKAVSNAAEPRLRVNVQLIDAESGAHLWADRFDKTAADLFDMQDEIVARLASALNAQLVTAEARRAERAPTPNSMDLYFQGKSSLNKGVTQESALQARDFFQRALALEPRNVDALIGLAEVDTFDAGSYMTDERAARLASAEAAAVRALSLAPQHAVGHLIFGRLQIYTNRTDQGVAECQRALALDRNLADACAVIGLAELVSGRPEQTET